GNRGVTRAAQGGWRVALANTEEIGSFCRLRVAQEGWRVAPGS
ncbi:hypothetical protein A2U01_0097310, partial [Trifolium medium]|nr:hypothetical protein [Trifolium medium]